MTAKSKKSKRLKSNENTKNKVDPLTLSADLAEIDLGDADNSDGNLGMDNFKRHHDKNLLPSERGRIEEL